MAENSLLKEIIIRAKAEGINEASSDLDVLQVTLDEIGTRGNVPTQTLNKLNKAAYGTADAAKQASASLPTLRYALYDVSSTLAMTGAAMTGLTVATASASIMMDRQFADVLRTSEAYLDSTGKSATNLRKEFEGLFTSMPVSWKDLTDIGTLAGQLNIAKEDIAEFSELVAKFAATTDVSVEQSATAFGRLSQLLGVPANEFENLGSSILAVGVNSVATESQIIATSTQLASMGNFAGFSADEVFGLSAALASLGTQPELSRGVITRLFTNISASISEGGERLDDFGRLAGMSGQEFAQAWGDDAAGALLKLMQGLGAVEGSKAVETLHELGITASRDVPTILRLAQNNEVLAESLQVASDGYRDGTALQEQYSVISSTVAEKINVLINNLQNFIATVGQSSGALGGLIDVAIAVVKAFTGLIDNPITATILGIVGALAAVTGPLLLMGALAVRGAASMIALRTALTEAAIAGGRLSSSAVAARLSLYQLTGAALQASGASTAFGVAARAALVGTGIGVALLAIGAAWNAVESAINGAQNAFESYYGSTSGLEEALKTDTEAYTNAVSEGNKAVAESFTLIQRQTKPASDELDSNAVSAKAAADILGLVGEESDKASASMQNLTVAVGANTLEWMKNALASNEGLKGRSTDEEFRRYLDLLTSVGFSMDQFLVTARDKGAETAKAYLYSFESQLQGTDLSDALELKTDQGVYDAVQELSTATEALGNEIRETESVNTLLGVGLGDTAVEADTLATVLFEIENAMLGSENAIFNLGRTLGESGGEFGYFSEEGRVGVAGLIAAMEALNKESGGVASVVVGDFVALRDALIQAGIGGGQAVDFLNAKIAELSGGKSAKSSGRDFSNLFSGWASGADKAARATRSAGSASKEARQEVRTLLDYAGDLAKVWNRAFDIRFSGQQTLDTITSSFIKIREEADAAAKRIRDLNNDISSLNSDISIQEYFLSIAVEYGDLARAQAIEAELAKKRAELADKTAELQKEQDAASKSLVGNSKGAIENRKTVMDLVKQYQAHIQALAASGMSQADLARETARLKQDFVSQATQMGYNRAELEMFTAAFEDVSYAIANVPPINIDVTGLTPAQIALKEMQSSVQNLRNAVGGGVNIPITTTSDNSGAMRNLVAVRDAYQAQLSALYKTLGGNSNINTGRLEQAILRINQTLSSYGYAQGGYTGAGGKYEPAGIVHRGEYVIPKHMVNQSTGLPYADALGRLSQGVSSRNSYASGGYVNPPTQTAMHIAPGSIEALANAVSKVLVVDGKVLADSSARVYGNETVTGSF